MPRLLINKHWSTLKRLVAIKSAAAKPYQEFDYLQTSGYNARIDTGVPGNDNTLVIDFVYMRLDNANYFGAFGNYEGEAKKCWRVIQSGTTYPDYCIVTAGNTKASSSMSIKSAAQTNIGHKVNFKLSWGKVETEDDTGYKSSATLPDDTSAEDSKFTIAIGANSPPGTGSTTRGRFYGHFRIWSQGELIRDYVPAVRVADNKAGFLDKVNGTFNPSIGSVEFIAGND